MVIQHTYCNKEISWSLRLFQKTDIARESVYLKTIDKRLTFYLIMIFNSFTEISFLKYVTKIETYFRKEISVKDLKWFEVRNFCVSYYFQEKISDYFKVQLSVTVFVYVLSTKEANLLPMLQIRTLGNILGKFSTEAVVLKCIPGNFFLEICRSFKTTSEKLALENYVLAYHTANMDYAEIW